MVLGRKSAMRGRATIGILGRRRRNHWDQGCECRDEQMEPQDGTQPLPFEGQANQDRQRDHQPHGKVSSKPNWTGSIVPWVRSWRYNGSL